MTIAHPCPSRREKIFASGQKIAKFAQRCARLTLVNSARGVLLTDGWTRAANPGDRTRQTASGVIIETVASLLTRLRAYTRLASKGTVVRANGAMQRQDWTPPPPSPPRGDVQPHGHPLSGVAFGGNALALQGGIHRPNTAGRFGIGVRATPRSMVA